MISKIVYNNDLSLRILDNGLKDFEFVYSNEFVRQKIKHNLLTFLGECFNDKRIGMPYKERILINSPDLISIRSIFYQAIMKTPGVSNVQTLTLDYDRKNRTLGVNFLALLESGEQLQIDSRNDIDFILTV